MSFVCSWSKYTLFYIVTVSMWGALSLIMLLTNQPRGLMFVQFTCFACAILSMCSRYYLFFDCSNSRVVGTNVWSFGKSTQQRSFPSESGTVLLLAYWWPKYLGLQNWENINLNTDVNMGHDISIIFRFQLKATDMSLSINAHIRRLINVPF